MDNIERFETLMSSVKRDGVDKLMEYIRGSDFYTAPASTRFHLCVEGGLLQHSLNVYDCLKAKKSSLTWKKNLGGRRGGEHYYYFSASRYL
jgi:23S rRNA maturation-related 3'-5' exoribonuclease YhaM